jgi:hypothetical protein
VTALAFPINGRGETSAWVPQKFRYWYDGIIDLLLADPTLSQKEIAQRMGRHAVTIGMVMNSDLFRARYEQRRLAQSTALQEKINDRIAGVAITSLELVKEQLDTKRTSVPLAELADVADKALSRLGYGGKTAAGPASVVQVNVGNPAPQITREDLERSRQKIIDAQASREGESRFPDRRFPDGLSSSEPVVVVPPSPEPRGGTDEES